MVRGQPGAVLSHRAAVLGRPVDHSLSPVLHEAAYAALGLEGWSYGRFEVDEGGLAPFVEGLDETWRGLSLTMPLKVAAFDVASEVSELARRAGAINTLSRASGGWAGDNTDVHGIVAALRDAGVSGPTGATIIGSGATARSALLALEELGASGVRVAARNAEAVAELGAVARVPVDHVPLADWAKGASPVVVSTVPGAGAAAAADATSGDLSGSVVLDVVYADWPTPLARAASAAGATVVSGLEMLVHQAARQHEIFTGTQAPVEAMQVAGRAALGRHEVMIRPLGPADEDLLRVATLGNVNWSGERFTMRDVADRPELAHYAELHPDRGDLGFVAERDGAPVGAAWALFLPADDAGFGFVDARTPELSLWVREDARGGGIGRQLLRRLLDEALRRGTGTVSLSVEDGNPARHLYETEGFRGVPGRERDGVMLWTPGAS